MRFIVLAIELERAPFSVILPVRALPEQVERALAANGVYAPRGLDCLRWRGHDSSIGTITDASGATIVDLCGVPLEG